ncbi:hypothetical protein KC19_3G102700 [Ceratodon purpureus]|uniref:Secreted protein n=1 Tax=Ceratodon purpureus TaxID=3225 RepID=A0A8T0IKE6_CERPU|nr:hypothetical protein KC19_3G102700 [Ceratodon purpureus]
MRVISFSIIVLTLSARSNEIQLTTVVCRVNRKQSAFEFIMSLFQTSMSQRPQHGLMGAKGSRYRYCTCSAEEALRRLKLGRVMISCSPKGNFPPPLPAQLISLYA